MILSSRLVGGTTIVCCADVSFGTAERTSTKDYPKLSPPSRRSLGILEEVTKACVMADGEDYMTARCQVSVSLS